jgi:hypothetical protein
MNRDELKHILEREKFRPNTYSLAGGEPDEALCLSLEDGRWYVYYSERGMQTGKVGFDSESEACAYFLEKMRSDPTTKAGWSSGFSI